MGASRLRVRSWIGGVLRQWQTAREGRRRARTALQDRRAADGLQRARDGYDRFPPSGG